MPKDLKMVSFHGWNVVQGGGCQPIFQTMIAMRIHKKMACNVVFTGEPGIGKSYLAMDVARVAEGCYRATSGEIKDRFKIDQIVFQFSDFMDLVLRLKSGKIIVFDEPSYAIGKREWYKKLNQALTKTIESFRFKVHPLFIPVVNKSLLDKTVRDHLVQFMVNVTGRGRANVYRLRPSQFKEKTYHQFLCELHYHQFDSKLCNQPSCLGCKSIETCQVFRAQYERKKRAIQDSRYEQTKEDAERTETRIISLSELEKMAVELSPEWFIEHKIHVQKLRIALADAHNIRISLNKAYQLKAALLAHNKELFDSSFSPPAL